MRQGVPRGVPQVVPQGVPLGAPRSVPRSAPRANPKRVRQRCIAGISSLHLKLLLALFSTICIFAFSFIVVACQTQALGLLRYDFLGRPSLYYVNKKNGWVGEVGK